MLANEFKGHVTYLWGLGLEGQSVMAWWQRNLPGQELKVIEHDTIPEDAEIVIKSPGVSIYLPQAEKARARGVRFTSLMNIFLAQLEKQEKRPVVIGITGTKGKSTTASLLAFMLEKLGKKTGLGGNIGVTPLTLLGEDLDYIVLELSSFQITDLDHQLDYGVIVNISQAHVDWHLSLANYIRDKMTILQKVRVGIVNMRDELLGKVPDVLHYGNSKGFHVDGGQVYDGRIKIDLPPLQLRGEHNLFNLCAGLTVLKELGLDYMSVLPHLGEFKGLPHRLQLVHSAAGFIFIDDSIATVPESTMAAVASFDEDIALIVGGYDNKPDFTKLDRFISESERVKVALCLPDTGVLIKNSKAVHVATMQEAVAKGVERLGKGGVVLLSPAAPSYNMYKNYKERGEDFARLAKGGAMNLKELLDGIVGGELPEIEISGISCDSRTVQKGDLFFAVSGTKVKGSQYAADAVAKGARAVVGDDDVAGLSVPCLKTDNVRLAIAQTAARFYPKQPKHIVAVTGTNGKTSTAIFAMQIFEAMGVKAAAIGTLGVTTVGGTVPGKTTTPDAIEIHRTLHMLAEKGIEGVAFEASSHGLDQHRIDCVKLQAAGFTNLTRDHLDYHKTMTSYGAAKRRLFYELLPEDGTAVLNSDDEFFQELKDCGRNVLSYGRSGKGLRLESQNSIAVGQTIKMSLFGRELDMVLPLAGDFQAMNALCAAGLVMGCGFDAEKVITCLSTLKAPHGRLELAGELSNRARVYVDYAHTPDALENALKSLRPSVSGKLAVLFGCGGDRDPGKRPLMGKVAEELADTVYVTDDNPRSEEPEAIRMEVLKGCPKKGKNAGERAYAIKYAIENLKAGDVLLIAGKGHEDYQEIKGVRHHFDDREEAIKAIRNLSSTAF